MASRVRALRRAVARLAGDEFAILIDSGGLPAGLVAHRVVASFDGPVVIDGQELLIRPSVGLAVASVDDPDISADALLKQADVAMLWLNAPARQPIGAQRARHGFASCQNLKALVCRHFRLLRQIHVVWPLTSAND